MLKLFRQLMRYQIITTESTDILELKRLLKNSPRALTIFYFLPENSFFYIACGKTAQILTPQFRRFLKEEGPLQQILSKLPHGSMRFIRRKDFLYLFRKLRELHKKQINLSRLFLMGDEIFYWQIHNKEQVKGLTVKKLNEVLWAKLLEWEATHLKLESTGFSKYEEIWLSVKKEFSKLRTPPDIVYFSDFYVAAALVYGLNWNHKTILVPYRKGAFRDEVVWPKIERVLVLTNISGEPLPQLLQNTEYWTKGMRGFVWRHIYGELSMERLLPIFSKNERYDLIVYRGHSYLRDGKIYIPDGDFPVEKLPAKFYLHLSCMDYGKQKKFIVFPARWNFLPAFRLLDFDDKTFLENFLKLWQKNIARDKVLAILKKTPFLTIFA